MTALITDRSKMVVLLQTKKSCWSRPVEPIMPPKYWWSPIDLQVLVKKELPANGIEPATTWLQGDGVTAAQPPLLFSWPDWLGFILSTHKEMEGVVTKVTEKGGFSYQNARPSGRTPLSWTWNCRRRPTRLRRGSGRPTMTGKSIRVTWQKILADLSSTRKK